MVSVSAEKEQLFGLQFPLLAKALLASGGLGGSGDSGRAALPQGRVREEGQAHPTSLGCAAGAQGHRRPCPWGEQGDIILFPIWLRFKLADEIQDV